MRFFAMTFIVLCIVTFLPAMIFAQSSGEFRTNGSGNWSDISKWQTFNGSAWAAASTAPTGDKTITIQGTDSIAVDVPITITDTIICTGGRLGNSGSTLTFASTGVWAHQRDAGYVPAATWNPGSWVFITGTTSAGPSFPSDFPVANVGVDLHAMTGNCQLNMTGTSLTINGNLWIGATVNVAGATAQIRLSGSNATYPSLYRTYHIGGDIIMDSTRSILTFCGSSSMNTGDSVYVAGNIRVNAGVFRINQGSGASGWLFLSGDLLISSGAQFTKHSSSTFPAEVRFQKQGRQNFINHGTISTGYNKPFDFFVDSGSVFNTGTGALTGGINFTLKRDATLETAKSGGVDSAIQVENGGGTAVVKTFESGTSYIFNGTVPQITGSLMPDTVGNLTIDNTAGVALTKPTLINSVLTLANGVFDNTVPFTLGPIGSINKINGSLLLGVKETSNGGIPRTFFVSPTYPNPFNPATQIEFGIPSVSHVRVVVFNLIGQEVGTLLDGVRQAGTYTLSWDASGLTSGVYFCRVQAGDKVEIRRMVLNK